MTLGFSCRRWEIDNHERTVIIAKQALRVREEEMLGVLGSVFGVLGIFTFGLLFVPLGLLCTLFSFFKGEILLGLVSLAVNVVAIFVSPTIWLVLFGAASNAPK